MVNEKTANYILNILLHILLLFVFLNILFFTYITKVEKENIDTNLSIITNEKVDYILSEIDNLNNKNNIGTINWSNINSISKNIEESSKGEDKVVTKNNNKIKLIGIMISLCLFTILFIFLLYFFFVKNYNINFFKIIGENLVLFIFVGIIEILFFTYIVSKYIPIEPNVLTNTLLERIKYHSLKN